MPEPSYAGRHTRSLPRAPNKQGLNLFNWSFRYADGVALTDTAVQLQRVPGATALPGAYSVRLTVGGKSEVQHFTLLADPRVKAAPAELRARYEQTLRVNRAVAEVFATLNSVTALRTQVEARRKSASANAALDATLHRFADSLETWSRRLAPRRTLGFDFDPYSTSALGELRNFTFGDMNSAPNQAERTGSMEALARARKTIDDVKRAIGAALPAVNDALKAANLSPLQAL